ncbi:MAG TPA: hypothetical protein VMF89_00115 [Polyangiales bacterium]|nr:hypothetical protein [Polyangiales bacterium]
MKPNDPHSELDIERDPLLRALSALPHEDLDAWRSERLRTRAHAELARARSPIERATSGLELLLMAACALLGIGRLAMALALIFKQ